LFLRSTFRGRHYSSRIIAIISVPNLRSLQGSRAGSLAAVLGALVRVCSERGLEQTSDARCWNLAAICLGRAVAAIERLGV
jgi:hypothetical protein